MAAPAPATPVPPVESAAPASDVLTPIKDVGDQLVGFLPKALLILAVIVVGLIVAWALRRGTRWLVRKTGLETFGEKIGASKVLYAIGAKGSVAHLLGTVVWIAVLLLTFSVVAEMLDLPGLAEGVAAITTFLPRLIAAGFVIICGLFLADLLRTLVQRSGDREGGKLESPRVVGQILYYTVVTVAVAMAVGQIGLETSLINILIAVIAAALFLSLGLAFALGARDIARNLMARHYLEGVCGAGDTLTIEGVTGVVVRFTATSVVLRAADGDHVVPCAAAMAVPFTVQRLPADTASEESTTEE